MLPRKYSKVRVDDNLTFGKNATLKVTNTDGSLSTVDILELAALDGIAAADLAKIDGITNGTVAAGKAIVPTTDKHIDALVISDGGLALGAGAGTAVTATAVELNYNDIATLGTLAASKAWTSDANLDTVMPTGGLLTMQSGAGQTYSAGSTLTLSGTVIQAPVFVADATPYTVLAADSGKLHIILEQTNTITLNLPVIAAGLSYKFIMGGVATEAQNWVIVATTPSFYNGGVTWDDSNAVASPVPVYGNGTSHLTLTATTPEAGTAIEIYSNGTEWFVCGAVFSAATPAFT